MIPINDKNLLRQKAWSDGQWRDSQSGKTIPVTNPADGSVLGSVPAIGRDEVHHAIDTATVFL